MIYGALRSRARSLMAREPRGHTLQPTALVHEAFVRLARQSRPDWDTPSHFFVAAAEAMRRILIERARRVARIKHGGRLVREPFDDGTFLDPRSDLLLALDRALDLLEGEQPRLAAVVKLRYFIGMSVEETAAILELSEATVKRDWQYARAWLGCAIQTPPSEIQ